MSSEGSGEYIGVPTGGIPKSVFRFDPTRRDQTFTTASGARLVGDVTRDRIFIHNPNGFGEFGAKIETYNGKPLVRFTINNVLWGPQGHRDTGTQGHGQSILTFIQQGFLRKRCDTFGSKDMIFAT
ncbi:MAG: hypothetical protein AAB553_00190 [Patescibacteria group bacterium]